jgi:glycosyltransferase involved in cell wall biosynthesis
MKIVVFSNLYPPLFFGGYEIGASQIVAELKRRGHEILLLTSREYYFQQRDGYLHRRQGLTAGRDYLETGLCVFGSLPGLARRRPLHFLRKAAGTLLARFRYRAALRRFRPDASLVFNPLGVVAPILDDLVACSKETGAPVHAYVSDHWLAGWPSANPLWPALYRFRQSTRPVVRLTAKIVGRLLRAAGLMPNLMPLIDRYLYCSDFIRGISRDNSVAVAGHEVVPWGLACSARLPPPDHFDGDEPLTLVYAGQLLEHKGLAVLIRALAHCRRRHRLVVFGDDHTDYAAVCKRLVGELGLRGRVEFAGRKAPGEMPAALASAGHLLVVPSVWDEPFSIVVLEGMAVGLPVIASATGGTPEAIANGVTGFLFARGNSGELAAVIDRLEADRALCREVSVRARQLVLERYTLEGVVDRILANVSAGAAPGGEVSLAYRRQPPDRHGDQDRRGALHGAAAALPAGAGR